MAALRQLGELVKAHREDRGLTQDDVARACPAATRVALAHLEQGLRLPAPAALEAVCSLLQVPARYWRPLLEPERRRRLAFEEALGELAGAPVSLDAHDVRDVAVAQDAVARLFGAGRTAGQAFDAFNAALVFYGVRTVSRAFFERWLGASAFESPDAMLRAVRAWQKDAIRLFPTFADAFESMNAAPALDALLAPLLPRSDADLRARAPWDVIEPIEESRLADLGYISAQKVRQEQAERQTLATFLRELAAGIRARGRGAVHELSEKKSRKMDSLLRKLDSKLPHGLISPLFVPDADQLEREADRLAPKGEGDIARIAQTEEKAQRNLARYLSADHLDVYVATSMRTEADFISVNAFVSRLFATGALRPLNLRHFNPTQSWIEDRVAKGLVEALMLRRAALTIYMAQKEDTFGKDSEASVALGQGKPVVVYVPRLHVPEADLDSDRVARLPRAQLVQLLAREGDDEREVDETVDDEALWGRLLSLRLTRVHGAALARVARTHWADFDLYSEASRVPEEDGARAAYRGWLDRVVRENEDEPPPAHILPDFQKILVATAIRFERRARIFREVHPLALQVILSTGVLNGILVVRSVDACADVVGALVRNELSLELQLDERNYRLVETTTGSTIRVISRHRLLANAFSRWFSGEGRA